MAKIEVTEKDETFKKIGTWKFDTSDIALGSRIFSHLINKYGLKYIPPAQTKEKDFLDMKVDW